MAAIYSLHQCATELIAIDVPITNGHYSLVCIGLRINRSISNCGRLEFFAIVEALWVGSLAGDVGSGNGDLGCGMWEWGCGIWELGCGIWNLGLGILCVTEEIRNPNSEIRTPKSQLRIPNSEFRIPKSQMPAACRPDVRRHSCRRAASILEQRLRRERTYLAAQPLDLFRSPTEWQAIPHIRAASRYLFPIWNSGFRIDSTTHYIPNPKSQLPIVFFARPRRGKARTKERSVRRPSVRRGSGRNPPRPGPIRGPSRTGRERSRRQR